MVPEIRCARPEEAGALVGTFEWLFADPGSQPPGWDADRARATLRELTDSPDSEVLVAELDGEVIGLCTVYRDIHSVRFGQRAWVEDLSVAPGRRSLGVGKRLLDAAMDWARAQGASHLELDSSTTRVDAHRFYEREQPSRRSLQFSWELGPSL